MQTIKQRVEAGAEFLDFIYGDEWRGKINLEELDISNSKRCVLGQTDSDYAEHAEELGLDSDDCFDFGFSGWRNDNYGGLTPVWKQLLRKQALGRTNAKTK